jgi:hypothetical protein
MSTVTIPAKVKQLTGMKFTRLSVISYAGYISGKSGVCWNCLCDCGNHHIANGGDLKRGNIRSCGCLSKELKSLRAKMLNRTHGLTECSLYSTWKNMRQRCNNPNNQDYHSYGGRGISVCKEWNNFATFKKDMEGKTQGLTIERIDTNKGYSKENCRWASTLEQARNKRTNKPITHNGKTMLLSEWSQLLGIKEGTLWMRIRRGWPVDQAFTTKTKETTCKL